jgi:hypothetical protein
MTRHEKTEAIIQAAHEVLEAYHPMTVRQVYYQLVSKQIIENNRGEYNGVSKALVCARQEGIIPWDWIEDRLRMPRAVQQWDDLADFIGTVKRSYRRDVWATQERYLECWLEKDALSGIFEKVLNPFGATLNVGRGFDGWSSIYNAAQRFGEKEDATILYFGDFDPSGEDMVRSLRERLAYLGAEPLIKKCALTAKDIDTYHLPPALAKTTDTRSAAFIQEHGNRCVELDALPADVLEDRIREEVESIIDGEALQAVREVERKEIIRLEKALAKIQ